MVICLERVADLHMAQLMPLLLTVSCFSKIQIGTGSSGQRAVKQVCVTRVDNRNNNQKVNDDYFGRRLFAIGDQLQVLTHNCNLHTYTHTTASYIR